MPGDIATRDIGIVARRIFAVIPIIGWRSIVVVIIVVVRRTDIERIGVDWLRVEEPVTRYLPPPAKMTIVPGMTPVATLPEPALRR